MSELVNIWKEAVLTYLGTRMEGLSKLTNNFS